LLTLLKKTCEKFFSKVKKDKIIASGKKVQTRSSVAQGWRSIKNNGERENLKRHEVGEGERRLVRIIG